MLSPLTLLACAAPALATPPAALPAALPTVPPDPVGAATPTPPGFPPVAGVLEADHPVLLARLPRAGADGEARFLGGGAAPGGRLLLVVAPLDEAATAPLGLDRAHALPARSRWLTADGAGEVRFALPQVEGLAVQLWRAGDAAEGRGSSHVLPLAATLAANYSGPPAVITEFLKDPTDVADSRGEWVEIANLNPWRLRLDGWVLSDDSGNSALLGGGVTPLRCGPGESIVIGADDDPATNGGVDVDDQWSSFSLRNSSDEIVLSMPDGTVVDRVVYDDGVLWPDTPGQSIALDPASYDVAANDDAANWCHSQAVWPGGTSDTGSPGETNAGCP